MDVISKLPIGIIETILCLIPIQEAARTSILSREWRYHWTKIPKLVFDERTFHVPTDGAELSVLEQSFDKPSKRKEMTKRCKIFYAIYQVLLMHEGPIHEFTLDMEANASCVEIDHILLRLSKKNTVKILKLDLNDMNVEYTLPISFFSLNQLTELHLEDCVLSHQPSFYEFGCLTTLNLQRLWTNDDELLDFLSSCPSLKRLTLSSYNIFGTTEDLTIVDLFKCIPLIEYISLLFDIVSCFYPERLPKTLPTPLVHLKCLRMESMFFAYKYELPFLFLMIKSSPNLEKLVLVMEDLDWSGEDVSESFTLEDYSDITLEHLYELEIRNFNDEAFELEFVQLILASSPALKKVTIYTFRHFDDDEAFAIFKILLCSLCVSPSVEIIVSEFKSY